MFFIDLKCKMIVNSLLCPLFEIIPVRISLEFVTINLPKKIKQNIYILWGQ